MYLDNSSTCPPSFLISRLLPLKILPSHDHLVLPPTARALAPHSALYELEIQIFKLDSSRVEMRCQFSPDFPLPLHEATLFLLSRRKMIYMIGERRLPSFFDGINALRIICSDGKGLVFFFRHLICLTMIEIMFVFSYFFKTVEQKQFKRHATEPSQRRISRHWSISFSKRYIIKKFIH